MNMPLQAVAVPLFQDERGGLRVIGTRVLLERIVHAFADGATPEGIVQSYDTLQLADVYAVLTWYLRNKAEVEDYLRRREEEAATIRRTIEASQPDRAELRARLTEVMKKESLGKWLQTPNEAFDGLKPLEVIEHGESDRIWAMIYFLRSGVPS
jgi:uncharacterized protein (DUF433 family)